MTRDESTVPIGTRIADRYVVEQVLGQGGMGIVARAYDERLRRSIALKLLRPSALGDGDARLRMLREAQAAARLQHPAIVHVHDTGPTEDGGQYVAMELVPGRSLRDLSRSGMDEMLAVRAVIEVAHALAAAHRAGLVHRDVKPDNVMLTPEGHAVLLDFGIARTIDGGGLTLTQTGTILGTPGYLAPEQARAQAVDGRADQYALAVTLYELVTGRLPWSASTAMALLAATVADPPEPLGRADARGVALEAALSRALAKDPRDRFPDCEAFAEALEHCRASRVSGTATTDIAPPSALPATRAGEPAPRPEPERPAERRTRARAAATLAAILMLGGTGLWASTRTSAPVASSGPIGLEARIACVPLELVELPESDGFLAAAAATDVCGRLRWARGGGPRTWIPAQIVNLSVAPDGDDPVDRWADPALRHRALALGRVHADATVEGRLSEVRGHTELRLTLRAGDGTSLASVHGEGVGLYAAVTAATDALLASGALQRATALDPEIAHWYGMHDPAVALMAHDAVILYGRTEPLGASCAQLAPARGGLGALASRIATYCRWPLEEIASDDPVSTLVRNAHARGEDPVEALARQRDEEPSELGRALLGLAECRLLLEARDTARARNACLAATRARPEEPLVWSAHGSAMLGTATGEASSRALLAWHPGDPGGWGHLGALATDGELRLRYLRRGYRLAPTGTSLAADLTLALVEEGRLGEARVLVAGIPAPDEAHAFARSLLDLVVTSAEGRPGQVVDALPALLERMPRFGDLVQQDVALAWLLVELTLVLGDPTPAEHFLHRTLDEPRLGEALWVLGSLTSVSLVVSAPERAWALERIAALDEAQRFRSLSGGRDLFDAARALERGDAGAALDALRPIAAQARPCATSVDPAAIAARLDALDPELAARFDAAALAWRQGLVGGAWSAVAREARRARRGGETVRARELAARVVEAWSTLDRAPPDLEDLRVLALDPTAP